MPSSNQIVIDPPVHGTQIRLLLTEKLDHEPIAEGFLYKHSSLMLSSQPGIGKSVIAIQAALELANGLPLFACLHVPKRQRVWYIQMERPVNESIERIGYMVKNLDVNFDNLYLDVELQALNFLNPAHFELILKRGHEIGPDVIIIDPLYGIATGLSKDETASQVAKLFTILKKELGCALWLNHHTVKNHYDIVQGEKVQKEDPFYGAQWLKAHVTASYTVLKHEEGLILKGTKDSHSNLLGKLKLNYDPETYLSSMKSDTMTYKERYKLFINARFRDKKPFTFREVVSYLGCHDQTIRSLNHTPQFSDVLSVSKSNGVSSLYTVKYEMV